MYFQLLYKHFAPNGAKYRAYRDFAVNASSINPLTHSARASQVPWRTASCRARDFSDPFSRRASSTRSINWSRVRPILSTVLIDSYSGKGEITTGLPVAMYSRTLIAEP